MRSSDEPRRAHGPPRLSERIERVCLRGTCPWRTSLQPDRSGSAVATAKRCGARMSDPPTAPVFVAIKYRSEASYIGPRFVESSRVHPKSILFPAGMVGNRPDVSVGVFFACRGPAAGGAESSWGRLRSRVRDGCPHRAIRDARIAARGCPGSGICGSSLSHCGSPYARSGGHSGRRRPSRKRLSSRPPGRRRVEPRHRSLRVGIRVRRREYVEDRAAQRRRFFSGVVSPARPPAERALSPNLRNLLARGHVPRSRVQVDRGQPRSGGAAALSCHR
jgi:hypothetical protein